jgi:Uma2 family endonuclease
VSTIPTPVRRIDNGYPTSDGKPMAETDRHRILMTRLIEMLMRFFAADPQVYVSGNLLVFYQQGNRRRHVSPDVFMVRGVAKHPRPNYLVWAEGRGPQVVIELTSSSTRHEDQATKRSLYQHTLKVQEYFLFDPLGDYLDPRLQGYRLQQGVYRPIRRLRGRLPSRVLGLHLEAEGENVRLFDPQAGNHLLTNEELAEQEHERAEQEHERADQQQQRADQQQQRADQAELEVERLRRQVEELRRKQGD